MSSNEPVWKTEATLNAAMRELKANDPAAVDESSLGYWLWTQLVSQYFPAPLNPSTIGYWDSLGYCPHLLTPSGKAFRQLQTKKEGGGEGSGLTGVREFALVSDLREIAIFLEDEYDEFQWPSDDPARRWLWISHAPKRFGCNVAQWKLAGHTIHLRDNAGNPRLPKMIRRGKRDYVLIADLEDANAAKKSAKGNQPSHHKQTDEERLKEADKQLPKNQKQQIVRLRGRIKRGEILPSPIVERDFSLPPRTLGQWRTIGCNYRGGEKLTHWYLPYIRDGGKLSMAFHYLRSEMEEIAPLYNTGKRTSVFHTDPDGSRWHPFHTAIVRAGISAGELAMWRSDVDHAGRTIASARPCKYLRDGRSIRAKKRKLPSLVRSRYPMAWVHLEADLDEVYARKNGKPWPLAASTPSAGKRGRPAGTNAATADKRLAIWSAYEQFRGHGSKKEFVDEMSDQFPRLTLKMLERSRKYVAKYFRR